MSQANHRAFTPRCAELIARARMNDSEYISNQMLDEARASGISVRGNVTIKIHGRHKVWYISGKVVSLERAKQALEILYGGK